MDTLITELAHENKLIREKNDALIREKVRLEEENARFKVVLGRIIAISQLAFRDNTAFDTSKVVSKEHDDKSSY